MSRKYILAILFVFISVSLGYAKTFKLTKNEQNWLNTRHEITLGVVENGPPQGMLGTDGLPKGVDVEVIELINKKLSGKVKIVTGPWYKLFKDAKAKRLDGLMNFTPSREHSAFFNFTRPYMSVPHVFIAKRSGPHFGNFASLYGHTIALVKGSFLVSYVQNKYPKVKIREFNIPREALFAVKNGDAKAYAGNKLITSYLLSSNNLTDIDIHGQSLETSDTNVIAVHKDLTILTSIIDKALASINHQKFTSIVDKWANISTQGLIMDKWINLKTHKETNWAVVWQIIGISSILLLLIVFWNFKIYREIKKRKQVEEQRDSYFNLSQDLICIAGMDGYFKYVSPSWEKTLGYTPEELLTRPFLDFIHPDDHGKNDEEVDSLANGNPTLNFENRYIHKNGSVITVSWVATPMLSEKVIYCTGRNITGNKKAELVMEKQQNLLDSTGSIAKVGGWELNTETLALNWTKEVYRIHEVGEDYIPDVNTAVNFYTPECRPQIQSALENAIECGGFFDLELKIETGKGNIAWVQSIGKTKDTDGVVTGMSGTIQDITERKRAEKELLTSSQFRENIMSKSPIGIIIYHVESGECVEVNNAACEVIGATKDKILAQNFYHLESWKTSGLLEKATISLNENIEIQCELDFTSTFGKNTFVDYRFSSFYAGDNRYLLLNVFDISDRKKNEGEKLHLERQVQHAQKLESLGVLAGGIAHDFNNILMGVLGNAELCLYDLPPENPVRDNLQDIVDSAIRAAELAKQMLAYSGKGHFVIESININRMIEEMVYLLKTSISKTVVLKFNLSESIYATKVDVTQVRQVFMNLVTNASEAIGERSGVITVSTGVMEVTKEYLEGVFVNKDIQEGFYNFIEVSDTGCGMDKEIQQKMFDPFFTTKFTGRGLGMAATLGIIRGHNGAIKIYSEKNKGTTIKVLFPCSEEPVEESNTCRKDSLLIDQWQGEGTILVVDDEESILAIAKKTLLRKGFSVLTAEDGREGLKVFSEDPDKIDLVILDITMPHMSGEETFSEMRKVKKDVQVLLSSGYNEKEATGTFAGKGLAGFIQKPYKPSELIQKLYDLLS
jgi:PAS domain S-box-containing protein